MEPAQNAPEALAAVLQSVLKAYEVLALIARHFHPPQFSRLMEQVGQPDGELKAALETHGEALASITGVNEILQAAASEALAAFAVFRKLQDGSGELTDAFHAFRHVPIGLEALYALAGVLPPVSRFFLDPKMRSDEQLQGLVSSRPTEEQVGIMHYATSEDGEGERGGFWLYVPEYYTPERSWPLVMALHGGSGTGRQFLWSWLRDARSRGAILVAPSSMGPTWALSGPDEDSANLNRMVEFIRATWSVDQARMLLTGMSDGGTFTYLAGLAQSAPFTHLAPVAAAFNPLLVVMSDTGRMQDLPVFVIHGAQDWMFPSTMANEAARTLAAAGARVSCEVIEDLSHTYPREMNATLLEWLSRPHPIG